MKNDVVTILDRAVTMLRAAGHEVDGWTLQSSEDGYVAWLYREDEESQAFLFDGLELQPTALEAARTCVTRAEALAAEVGTGVSS